MWRHIESDDLTLRAEVLEILRVVARVAVNYKQPVRADSTRSCIHVKVL